jgi:hypothetical protein
MTNTLLSACKVFSFSWGSEARNIYGPTRCVKRYVKWENPRRSKTILEIEILLLHNFPFGQYDRSQ